MVDAESGLKAVFGALCHADVLDAGVAHERSERRPDKRRIIQGKLPDSRQRSEVEHHRLDRSDSPVSRLNRVEASAHRCELRPATTTCQPLPARKIALAASKPRPEFPPVTITVLSGFVIDREILPRLTPRWKPGYSVESEKGRIVRLLKA